MADPEERGVWEVGPGDHLELAERFVVVRSVGGPYEDEAYCAGVEHGRIDEAMARDEPVIETIVRTANVPQLDLLAMRRGYTCEAKPWGDNPELWSFGTFRRNDEADE